VGASAAEKFASYLGDVIPFSLANTAITTAGALNNSCGADFVKTSQKLPPSLTSHLKPGQRACSLDGDADRLIYFYLDERGSFHMLDGDKIAALISDFIVGLVKSAGLQNEIKVGVVQTAYANGASTRYLSEVRSDFWYVGGLIQVNFFFPVALTGEVCSHWREAPPPCC
jgi:phosphoacetylglucosamine mutase